MSKGKIVSSLGSGQYTVELIIDTDSIQARIDRIDERIDAIDDLIASETDPIGLGILQAKKTGLEKAKSALENAQSEFDGQIETLWCADMTDDISADTQVGLCEVPGETGARNIQPGYDGNAAYSATRDGQLRPAIADNMYAVWLHACLTPGARKWRPLHRYGTITAIDYNTDTCSLTLDAATSSYLFSSHDANQSTTLSSVPIQYMECNSRAFLEYDEVLVEFTGYSWSAPKVIGFKASPKTCAEDGWVVFRIQTTHDTVVVCDKAFVWDPKTGSYATGILRADDSEILPAEWPVDYTVLNAWKADKYQTDKALFTGHSRIGAYLEDIEDELNSATWARPPFGTGEDGGSVVDEPIIPACTLVDGETPATWSADDWWSHDADEIHYSWSNSYSSREIWIEQLKYYSITENVLPSAWNMDINNNVSGVTSLRQDLHRVKYGSWITSGIGGEDPQGSQDSDITDTRTFISPIGTVGTIELITDWHKEIVTAGEFQDYVEMNSHTWEPTDYSQSNIVGKYSNKIQTQLYWIQMRWKNIDYDETGTLTESYDESDFQCIAASEWLEDPEDFHGLAAFQDPRTIKDIYDGVELTAYQQRCADLEDAIIDMFSACDLLTPRNGVDKLMDYDFDVEHWGEIPD